MISMYQPSGFGGNFALFSYRQTLGVAELWWAKWHVGLV